MHNYYEILGISQNASNEDIRTAYRKLALKFHPDKNPGDLFFEQQFKVICEANEILSNPKTRNNYDNQLSAFLSQDNFIGELKAKDERIQKLQDELRKSRIDKINNNSNVKKETFQAKPNNQTKATEKPIPKNNDDANTIKYTLIGIAVILFLVLITKYRNNNNNEVPINSDPPIQDNSLPIGYKKEKKKKNYTIEKKKNEVIDSIKKDNDSVFKPISVASNSQNSTKDSNKNELNTNTQKSTVNDSLPDKNIKKKKRKKFLIF